MAVRIIRRLRNLLDVDTTGANDGDHLAYDSGTEKWVPEPAGSGAPADAAYLVTTADGTLTNEVVVGATPGGELGGTWGSPTVDAVHSGSSHAQAQAAAEATAAAALAAHTGDPTDAHDASAVSFTPAGGIAATDVQAAVEELDAEKAATAHAHAGEDITSGTVADARIASTIARDSEVSAAVAASEAGQVRDGDAAGGVLGGTYPNPSFAVDMATQAELDAHTTDASDAHDASAISNAPAGSIAATDVQGAINELDAEKQPLDSDLTAIAALSPANDDVIQRKAGAWTNRTIAQLLADLAAPGTTFQPLDSDLTAIASLSTTAFGRSLLALADAAALRAAAGLVIGTDVQAYDAELAALAALVSAANKLPYFTGSGSAALADLSVAGRALIDDADASAQRTTLGLGTIATQAASGVAITGGSITGITDLAVADGGTGASTAFAARTNLNLQHAARLSAKLAQRGILDENYPLIGNVTSGVTPANGWIYYMGNLGILNGGSITGVVLCVTVAAAGTNPTGAYVGLYAADGTRLAVSNNLNASSSFTTTGMQSFAFSSPYAATTDQGVYAAVLLDGTWGTTQPKFAGNSLSDANIAKGFGSGQKILQTSSGGGNSSLPSSATFAAPGGAAAFPWAALY